MHDPLRWWPGAERSRFHTVGSLRWHVQHWPCEAAHGEAPQALLLHGTGAGSFSWRGLAPMLAAHFDVHAPDLPGHGQTLTPRSQPLTLPDTARALADWLRASRIAPALIIGHSAGAALAARMALDGAVAPSLIVSLNGALLPLPGAVARMFRPLARLCAGNPLVVPAFVAWASGRTAVRRLLASTGSTIDATGERCYAHLVADPSHVAGVLRLMASWDLGSLAADLPRLATPLLLIATLGDRMVPPSHAVSVQAIVPQARRVTLPNLGHLAHEEDPQAVFAQILQSWSGHQRPPRGHD